MLLTMQFSRLLCVAGMLAIGVVAAGDAFAAILAYEGFEYERRQGHAGAGTAGIGIDGLNTGIGFSGPWMTAGTLLSGIPEGEGDYGTGETYGTTLGARIAPLAYTDESGRPLITRGNQLRTSFGSRSREERLLAEPIGRAGTTVWLSFLGQAHGNAGENRYAFVELSAGGTDPLRFGNVLEVSSGNWGVETPVMATDAGADYKMNRPTLFLVRMEFPSDESGTTCVSMWLNPRSLTDPFALPLPLAIHRVQYRQYDQLAIAGRYSTDFDEIRIGETFADVLPTDVPARTDARLKIERDSGGHVRLSLPAVESDAALVESSADLEAWTAVEPVWYVGDDVATTAFSMEGDRGFFRVRTASAPGHLSALEESGWERKRVRRGLIYYERHFTDLFGDPQVVNVLAVDLDDPGIRLELTAMDVWGLTRRTVPAFAEQVGAIAAINGGFAPGRTHPEVGYGLMKFRGEVWPFVNDPSFHENYEGLGRNAVGIDEAGNWHFASRGQNGWEVGARWPDDWPGMVDVMAGGSQLVLDGQVHPLVVRATTQGAYLSEDSLYQRTFRRHPRTAIGVTPDRIAVLVTVAGRFPEIAAGMTLHETAELMRRIGCDGALELDGGGSTTMWIAGDPFNGVVNYPTDNGVFDHDGARSLRLAVLVLEAD